MFTGLIETTGRVHGVLPVPAGRRLSVEIPSFASELELGESVAINGCCLTVVELEGVVVSFEVGPETMQRTNLGRLDPGDRVNLERALRADGRFGGHIVQGHIDGTAAVRERRQDGPWEIVWFACGELASNMVSKGSVAVDGVSLTLCDIESDAFSVMLIPHTLENTTLGDRAVGSMVNIEVDVMAKYVRQMLQPMVDGLREELLASLASEKHRS